MDILSFFNREAPCQRVIIPSAQVNGRVETEDRFEVSYLQEEEDVAAGPSDYAQEYVKEEEELCLKLAANNVDESVDEMYRPDTPTSLATMLNNREHDSFGNMPCGYNTKRKIKADLPIFDIQDSAESIISSNGICVIQGPTGCGKTTQIPQFILDMCYAKEKYCKITVAQPRRLAAISVAKRVSEERGWPLGTVVGYQVGLDVKMCEDTALTYMTTGVLLQKLINMKNMNQYTHVILDEIHERNQEMDFLLLLVRRFFRTNSARVKVILMSATIEVDEFSKYFSIPIGNEMSPAVILDVGNRQPYIVNIYYLNQFAKLLDEETPEFNFGEPKLNNALYKVAVKLLSCFNEMDSKKEQNGSVLIFLPGICEIEELYELLASDKDKGPVKWFIVPLHSSITVDEQRKAFEVPQPGYRKIILSTNIAESSITVPDVVYVIDFCLTKMMICDSQSNYSSLKLEWASKTNCEQRAGRVGRVSSGKVYRMVSEDFYNDEMEKRQTPEMLRCPLHRLVLYSKMLELNIPPQAILALAMNPPNLNDIEQTINLLKEVGALLNTAGGVYKRQDGDLTHLGSIIGHIPLDLHAAKLIALGYLFSCSHETIIMATGTAFNIFSSPFNDRMKAYLSKLSWADGSCSDLIAYLHVYSVWERNRVGNLFGAGGERAWMQRNFLQPKILKEWRHLIQDIKLRLQHFGITEPIDGRTSNLTENEKGMMIKVVICGAYYPNYFVRSSEGGQVDESMAVRLIGGRDPYNTVYFSGRPVNQPGELYTQTIRKLLDKDCGHNAQVSLDSSSKIYVQFKKDSFHEQTRQRFSAIIPGKIPLEIYRAVKYRQLRLPTTIPCLPPHEAAKRCTELQNQKKLENALKHSELSSLVKSAIPSLELMFVMIEIIHTNNPGHFYAHNVSDLNIITALKQVFEELNKCQLKPLKEQPSIGSICAAQFNKFYYRAKIVSLVPKKNELQAQIIFIDYGNTDCLPVSELRELPYTLPFLPPLSIECILTGIQPSLALNPRASWTDEATQFFKQKTSDIVLYGKIYSVVDDVLSLELFVNTTDRVSINHQLIEKKFGEPAEESYLSKDNHRRREQIQATMSTSDPINSYDVEWIDQSNELTSPKSYECRSHFNLKGPHSPLEMSVHSITQCSQGKLICIEWSSVNSVLLDVDPQNPHDRLLVAATVGQSVNGGNLNLRHTTLMPNIHGFPAMMAMIFCPRMEIHVDKEGTKITSLLCGLGCDPTTKKPYFPAHDVVINLDFELTDEDITFANEVRYFMNMGLQAISCYKSATCPQMSIESCQNEIRNRIRSMFRRTRKDIEREILPNANRWGDVPKCVKIVHPQHVDDDKDIWPMHCGVQLNDPTLLDLRKNIINMKLMANKTVPMTEITCKFCQVTLHTIYEMRLHLLSQSHKELEQQNPVDTAYASTSTM